RVHPDIRPVVHAHRLDQEIGLDDRHVDRVTGVLAAEHLRAGPPSDVLAELEVAAIEIALRTDPGVRADDRAPVVAPLQEGLVPDEHSVSDREGVRMKHEHADTDAHAVTERLAERAQQHTPLARAVGAIEVGRGRVALEEGLARLALAQAGRLRDLVGRIGRDLLDAVDRLDRSRRQWLLANSRIEVVTRSICSSVSSGYMGIESTSAANRSVMGKSPLRYPRNSADCCRWIGTGLWIWVPMPRSARKPRSASRRPSGTRMQ